MQTNSNTCPELVDHDTILNLSGTNLFSHLEKNSHHHSPREHSISLLLNWIYCRLLNIFWHQRQKSRRTSFYRQLLCSASASQDWWWCAWLAANYNFGGLGGIPRIARLVLQASKKLHRNIIKQKSTHSSLILPCCPAEQRIYHAVEPVLALWCVWNQHWCARLAEQTNGASSKR